MNQIAYGYCQCGCGEKTRIAVKTNTKCGDIKGEPRRFLPGHNLKFNKSGERSPRWNGGKTIQKGYVSVWIDTDNREAGHRLAAEKALGRKLKGSEIVHHIDGDKRNNSNGNLLVCNRGYHNFLHSRIDALAVCGNAKYRKCAFCHQYDDPKNMRERGGNSIAHKKCVTEYDRKR